MAGNGIKISALNSIDSMAENTVIPVVSANTPQTNKVTLNEFRLALDFESAFPDIPTATQSTLNGEIFFTYKDSTQTSVLAWLNQGGGSYAALSDNNGVQLEYLKNNFPIQNTLDTISSLLNLNASEITYLRVGVVMDALSLIVSRADKRMFLSKNVTGTVINWVVDDLGCTVVTSAGSFYLNNYVVLSSLGTDKIITDVKQIIPSPDGSQNVIELNFGGEISKGTLGIDSRGRLSIGVEINGLPAAKGIHVPFSEGTGFPRGPYQDTITRFPIKGMADDDTAHGILSSYDTVRGLPILYAVSPLQYDKQGLVSQGTTYGYGTPLYHQVRELAQLDSIGRSLGDSFDAWFIYDNNGVRFHRMAVITNPSNSAGVVFSGVLTMGSWVTQVSQSYNLTVYGHNISGLSPTNNNNISSIKWRVKLTSTHGELDTTTNTGRPQVGLTLTAAGVMEVWLKIPSNASRLSYMSVNSGNRDQIKFNFDLLYTRFTDLLSIEPPNIIWKAPAFTYSSDNTVMDNAGSLHHILGGGVLRVGNATVFTKRPDILSDNFIAGGTYHAYNNVNENMARVTVTFDSTTNFYTVTGVGFRWDTFRMIAPVGFYDQSLYVVNLESTGTSTLTFSVRQRKYALNNATVTNGALVDTTVNMTNGPAIPIPDNTWADLSVQW